MNERFKITNALICPVHLNEEENLKLHKDYHLRLCVIDLQNNIAVDVEHELQYIFIRTMSGLYYKSIVASQNINNKRVVLRECDPMFGGTNDYDLMLKAREIKNNLKNGKRYPDGNEVLSNEEYLALLNKEKTQTKEKKKIKR